MKKSYLYYIFYIVYCFVSLSSSSDVVRRRPSLSVVVVRRCPSSWAVVRRRPSSSVRRRRPSNVIILFVEVVWATGGDATCNTLVWIITNLTLVQGQQLLKLLNCNVPISQQPKAFQHFPKQNL